MDASQVAGGLPLRARGLPRVRVHARAQATALFVLAAVLLPPAQTSRPSAPANLLAVPGPGTIELSWQPPKSNGTGRVIGVRVYRDGAAIATLPAGARSYIDDSVEAGAIHAYRVAAVSRIGEGARSSGLRASGLSVPGAPTTLSHDPVSIPGAIVLQWAPPPIDGGSNITGYGVYRNGELVRSIDASTTTYTDDGLTGGQDHVYEISARNELGEGPRSLPLTARVAPTPLQIGVKANTPERVRTTTPLIGGVTYIVEASGVYGYGPGQADAECSNTDQDPLFTSNRWAHRTRGDVLDLHIGGVAVRWEPSVPTTQGCSIDHVYRYRLRPTVTGVLEVGIIDINYSDNKGLLLVKIYPQG